MNSTGRKYSFSEFFRACTRIVFPGVLFVAIASSCNNDPEEIKALTGHTNKSEDRAEDVTIIISKQGKFKMRLFAHQFIRNTGAKHPYVDMNNDIRAEFYNDSGIVESTLTADSSRYYEDQGNILVWDSVKIVRKAGETLTTDELIWNNSIEKFFTEKEVRIVTANETLYGIGMEANRDFSWYQILHPSGTVRVNKGEMPQ